MFVAFRVTALDDLPKRQGSKGWDCNIEAVPDPVSTRPAKTNEGKRKPFLSELFVSAARGYSLPL